MKNNIKYTCDSYEVFVGNKVIARSYLGHNGYEVCLLQGMNREQTVTKIIQDCPEFAKVNNLNSNTIPKLFKK